MKVEDLRRDGEFWYLASPYTDPDFRVRTERAEISRAYHGWFLRNKVWTLPTIWLTHQEASDFKLPFLASDWIEYNKMWMDKSCGTIIACIDGWQTSVGVVAEMNYTLSQHKLVVWAKFDWRKDSMQLHKEIVS